MSEHVKTNEIKLNTMRWFLWEFVRQYSQEILAMLLMSLSSRKRMQYCGLDCGSDLSSDEQKLKDNKNDQNIAILLSF